MCREKESKNLTSVVGNTVLQMLDFPSTMLDQCQELRLLLFRGAIAFIHRVDCSWLGIGNGKFLHFWFLQRLGHSYSAWVCPIVFPPPPLERYLSKDGYSFSFFFFPTLPLFFKRSKSQLGKILIDQPVKTEGLRYIKKKKVVHDTAY